MTAAVPHAGVPMAVQLDFMILLTAAERAALEPPQSPFGPLPGLPAELYGMWRLRADLYRAFDLRSAPGYAGLWMWLVRDGRREVDLLRGVVANSAARLQAPVAMAGAERLPVEFPWLAALLWLERGDLRSGFPSESLDAMARYLGWFLRTGVFEGRSGDLLPDGHVRVLAGPGESVVPPPLIRYLELLWAAHPDLQQRFDMAALEGRRDFLKWFFGAGLEAFPTHPHLLDAQTRLMFAWGGNAKVDDPAAR